MDFTAIAGALVVLLGAIPTLVAYLNRQTRHVRKQNQQLRAIVQEADLHLFLLERRGFTERGERPPPRPGLLRAVEDEDSSNERAPATGRPPDEPDTAGGGSRHATP